ncbi:MAG: endonuclease/exonuclease/phosphatase family protein [Phycisphaerae bacterium]|nr:endonuclease/exonuclease/phosphatase family protein [Phycisphaerae bacterium]
MRPLVRFLALGAVPVVCLLPILSLAEVQTRPSSQQPRLRVVTWNIHGCTAGVDGIVDELRKIDADIICLQEAEVGTARAEGADQAALIAERLGMKQYSAGSRFAEGGGEQRMAILARGELEQTGPLDAGTGRVYGVSAVTRWNGRPLRVVSIHLTSTYRVDLRHAAETSRARFKEASDLAARLKKWTEDVVVAGDFNAIPGSPEHVALAGGLKRVPTTQPTFPSDRPRLPIDHMYLSDGLRADRRVVRDSLASDHRAVVVELTAVRGPDSRPADTAPVTQGTGSSIHRR